MALTVLPCLCVASVAGLAAAQPTVLPLEIPEGMDHATTVFVSEDGSSVVGNVFSGDGLYVIRWDLGSGWGGNQFPDMNEWSVSGMSDAGDVIALYRRDDGVAFIWYAHSGLQALESGEGINTGFVTGDGRVVLGFSFGVVTCRWVHGVYEKIGAPGSTWVPHVCTEEGDMVFGHEYFPGFVGIIEDVDAGSTRYPAGPTPAYDAYINDVNSSGTIGVGFALEDPNIFQDSGDGFSDLALPCRFQDGEYMTMAVAPKLFYQYLVNVMSEDGSLAFGYANKTGTVDEQIALVWSGNENPVSLSAFLEAEGASIDGWVFESVTDVSDDGRFIVGTGRFESEPTVFRVDRDTDQVCVADMSGDGELDFFDVSAFLVAFLDQDASADLTGDGSWDFFDASAFLKAYSAGCP